MIVLMFSVLFLLGTESHCQALIGVFHPSEPGDTYTIGSLQENQSFNLELTWNSTSPLVVNIAKGGSLLQSLSATSSPYSLNYLAKQTGVYSVRIRTNITQPIPYTLLVTNTNGSNFTSSQLYDRVAVSYNYVKAVHCYNVDTICNNSVFVTNDSSMFATLEFATPGLIPYLTDVDIGVESLAAAPAINVSLNQTGMWYFIIQYILPEFTYSLQFNPYFEIRCRDYCGDGVKQYGEQCDNGNFTGCVDCVADALHSCGGNASGVQCLCARAGYFFNMSTLQCDKLNPNSNSTNGSMTSAVGYQTYKNVSIVLGSALGAYLLVILIGATCECMRNKANRKSQTNRLNKIVQQYGTQQRQSPGLAGQVYVQMPTMGRPDPEKI